MAALFPLSAVAPLRAEEPHERFLQKLREEQLFDLALVYVNDLQTKPDVSPQLKVDLELERGLLLYQAAALLPVSNPQRPQKLDAAEAVLQSFLANRQQHPRRGEARLKLGELLLARAEEARRQAADGQQENPQAVKFYGEAHQLFEATIGELAGILEGLKGARVDAADSSAVAYRQKLQQDIRQAQLLSAKSIEERGRSQAAGSPQRTQDLQTALQMFSDLYAKELSLVAVRNYALFYRSGVQAELGKIDDAIDGYQRIVDAEGVDFLRPLQSQALSELIQLLATQQKFQVAAGMADKWLAEVRPDERTAPQTLNLKLELAELKSQWAQSLQAKNAEDRVAARLVRDARTELQNLLRSPGAHQAAARELLGKLGVSDLPEASSELPEVKSFAEALAAAQERIDRAETSMLAVDELRAQRSDPQTPPQRQQELESELAAAQATIDTDQQQALILLQRALQLFGPGDRREQLYDARFRLAFLLLKQQRPWESMAVAEFLSRGAPGTDQGLRAAAIALASLSDLLRTASAEAKSELTQQLRPFAEYLVATWPQSSEASAAAAALVQLALMQQDFDQAQQFLGLVPAGSPATAKLRREAGLTFYAQYVEAKKKAAGEATEASEQLRRQAEELLHTGTSQLSLDDVDATAIDAMNVLARLWLAEGKVDEAAELLLTSPTSPLNLPQLQAAQPNDSQPSDSQASDSQATGTPALPVRTLMATYRTVIQLKIALASRENVAAGQLATEIRDYIQRLQGLASDPASSQLLADTFVGLARDLKEQLMAVKDDQRRRQMSSSLLLVAAEAAKAGSFNTEYWAADTILTIAQELEASPGGKPQAQAAYRQAADILAGILAKHDSQPDWISPPEAVTQVRLKLAQTSRGLGDYKQAIEQLATILEKNSGLLDVQIEAARTYQAWGSAVNSGFHRAAISGGRPDPKSGAPLIWGWGKIQQLTANQPKYSEQFFEARYQLAYSRWQYARGLSDAAARTAETARAIQDIESTAKLYPQLGGPEMKKRFQALLKAIQAE